MIIIIKKIFLKLLLDFYLILFFIIINFRKLITFLTLFLAFIFILLLI